MSLLLLFRLLTDLPKRNRREVNALLDSAPTGRHSLEWWQQWLQEHWQ